MLRRQLYAAASSSPDAIGIISWNEFSENSHIEPSVAYGTAYVSALAETRGLDFDPEGELLTADQRPPVALSYGLPGLAAMFVLLLASLWRVVASARRPDPDLSESGESQQAGFSAR